MKRFVKSILLFITFSFCLYIFLICLWGQVAPSVFKKNLNYQLGAYGHMHTRLKEIANSSNVDILFLGSSHAYRGFDPRIFNKNGFSAFNLGSSGQSPMQTEVLLSRHLKKINPKLVIYEVYPDVFTTDGVESTLDIISNDRNDFSSIVMALKQNNIKVWNTLIYAFFCDLFNVNINYVEENVKGDDTYISGGYVQKALSYYKIENFSKSKWEFNKEQFNSFERCLVLIKNLGVSYILVQAPITKSRYASCSNNDFFDGKMNKYGQYYNFNKLIDLNDSLYFYDSHHLNQNGVTIFNNELIKEIEPLLNKNFDNRN